jgi:hypothetical protein
MPAGPDQPNQLIEEQDQPNIAEHVIEVIAPVNRLMAITSTAIPTSSVAMERQERAGDEASGQRREVAAK